MEGSHVPCHRVAKHSNAVLVRVIKRVAWLVGFVLTSQTGSKGEWAPQKLGAICKDPGLLVAAVDVRGRD